LPTFSNSSTLPNVLHATVEQVMHPMNVQNPGLMQVASQAQNMAKSAQQEKTAVVKAIASGNPAVLTLAEAEAELQRLTLLKKNHVDEQYVARRSVRDLPRTIPASPGAFRT
jgi:hypothetical protein